MYSGSHNPDNWLLLFAEELKHLKKLERIIYDGPHMQAVEKSGKYPLDDLPVFKHIGHS